MLCRNISKPAAAWAPVLRTVLLLAGYKGRRQTPCLSKVFPFVKLEYTAFLTEACEG
jgi:hypothetical protein